MNKFAKIALAAAAAASFGAQAGVTIDNFDVAQAKIVDGLPVDGLGVWSQVGPAAATDIFGGYRDIFVKTIACTVCGTGGETKAVVGGSVYSFSSDSGVTGIGIIRWDGLTAGASSVAGGDGTWGINKIGIAATDLTAGGAVAFQVKVLAADLGFPFTVQIFSDATNWTSLSIVSGGVGTFFIPFAAFAFGDVHGTGANFSSVRAAQALINIGDIAGTESVDLTIDLVNTTPEPGSLALVGLALLGVGAARRIKSKKA